MILVATAGLLAAEKQPASPFGVLILPAIFVLFWLFLIRPQQRARRAHFQMVRAVEVGDEIETAAGMYGRVTRMDETTLWVEVAPNVVVRMSRGAVRRKIVGHERVDPE
jgi:preprotein translocase subunit YajC